MQITAATFTDPSMRPQLEQYYENKKAAAIEAINAREPVTGEIKFRNADGSYQTATAIPISAEKMAKAIVSFDKWLEFQAESFNNRGYGPKSLEQAQQQVDNIQANHPDTSSNVSTTFSNKGVLLASINADGSVATSNGAEAYLNGIIQKANDRNLSGQTRVDYLNREIKNALSDRYSDLKTTQYDAQSSPTKREFSKIWHTNFDIDQHYRDAIASAKDHFDSVNAWHQQWQKNMNEIQSFLLSVQENASA